MAAATKAKRSHKTLTIEQKLKLLDKIGKVSYTILCEEYGVGCSTITDLKKKEASLRECKRKLTDQGVKRPAKVMKLGKDEDLETALFLWFKQRCDRGGRLRRDCNSKPIVHVSYFSLECKHFSNIQSPNFLIGMMAMNNTMNRK